MIKAREMLLDKIELASEELTLAATNAASRGDGRMHSCEAALQEAISALQDALELARRIKFARDNGEAELLGEVA